MYEYPTRKPADAVTYRKESFHLDASTLILVAPSLLVQVQIQDSLLCRRTKVRMFHHDAAYRENRHSFTAFDQIRNNGTRYCAHSSVTPCFNIRAWLRIDWWDPIRHVAMQGDLGTALCVDPFGRTPSDYSDEVLASNTIDRSLLVLLTYSSRAFGGAKTPSEGYIRRILP